MDRWQKIERLFTEAAALALEERAAFLGRSCDGDDELRSEVESLLEAQGGAETFLAAVVEDAAVGMTKDRAEQRATTGPGERMGPYELIELLGRGGMSSVYRAIRADDEYSKVVAVKVLRSGFLGADTLERFRQERQILADLEHPNIARLIDGGTREDGTPFVVMELIDGIRIDEYSRRHALGVTERVALFRKVCAAVQFAHQRLVVHRDLKPSNILVESDGTPKLLDFGIAKLLDAEVPNATVTGSGWMTPEYASPEQVRAGRVSTASDVYSLGAVLYELLTDCRPYELASRSAAEIERVVCETVPSAPSKAVTAGRRADTEEPFSVKAKHLRGDLDNIVLMALRKEPERRYRSAGELDDDLERFEGGLPVRSRPDTLRYRSRKFISRHRAGVAAGALFLVLLGAFGFLMFLQSLRLATERDTAKLERDKARRVAAFMSELLTTADEAGVMAGDLTAQELIDRGAEKLADDELADQPTVRATLLVAVAKVYGFYDQQERAMELYREAHALRLGALGAAHLETAESHALIGKTLHRSHDYESAEVEYRKALELRRRLAGELSTETADSLEDLAKLFHDRGDFEPSDEFYAQALEVYRALRGGLDPKVLQLKQAHAQIIGTLGRNEEELQLLQEVLDASIQLYGEDHLAVADISSSLAVKLKNDERFDQAEPLYRRALAIRRQHLGVHTATARSMNNLAVFLRAQGAEAEAGSTFAEAITMYIEVYGPEHPETALITGSYGSWHRDQGLFEEAEDLYETALASFRSGPLGPEHWVTAYFQSAYGLSLLRSGEASRGEKEMSRGVDLLLVKHPHNYRTKEAVQALLDWYRDNGRGAKADALQDQAEEIWNA